MPTTPAYEVKRRAEKPWRRWYNSKEWYRLRDFVFKRDSISTENGRLIPICQATGKPLTGKHPAPDSPVADHIKPHRGDPNLFFSSDNVWTVSKLWHDSVKQSHEKKPRPQIGRDGWPVVGR